MLQYDARQKGTRCPVRSRESLTVRTAPYDRVIVTAGAPRIPAPLVEQLHVGGRMVLPVGGDKVQQLILVDKKECRFVEFPLIGCRFVKLVGEHGWATG